MFKQGQSIPPVVFFRVNTINISLKNKTNHTTINTYVHFQTFVQAHYGENFFLRFFISIFYVQVECFHCCCRPTVLTWHTTTGVLLLCDILAWNENTTTKAVSLETQKKFGCRKSIKCMFFLLLQSLLRSHVWDQLKDINFSDIRDYNLFLLIMLFLYIKTWTKILVHIWNQIQFYCINTG